MIADWRKSSYSGANGTNCVEVGTWRKSSYSGANAANCVEAATAPGGVLVRDTTNRTGAVLSVNPRAWTAFLATIS